MEELACKLLHSDKLKLAHQEISILHPRESRHPFSAEIDRLVKHRRRPHPQSAGTIKRLIDDHDFLRLRVVCQSQHLVIIAFVMAVKSRAWFGRQWRQVAHLISATDRSVAATPKLPRNESARKVNR